jgi:hypothetical protein
MVLQNLHAGMSFFFPSFFLLFFSFLSFFFEFSLDLLSVVLIILIDDDLNAFWVDVIDCEFLL